MRHSRGHRQAASLGKAHINSAEPVRAFATPLNDAPILVHKASKLPSALLSKSAVSNRTADDGPKRALKLVASHAPPWVLSVGAKSISTRAPFGSRKNSCHTPPAWPPSGSRRKSYAKPRASSLVRKDGKSSPQNAM